METQLIPGMLRVWRDQYTPKRVLLCPYVLIGAQIGAEWLVTFLIDGSAGLWIAQDILRESRPFWLQEGDMLMSFREVQNLHLNAEKKVALLVSHQLDSGRRERREELQVRGVKFIITDTWRRY